jgi:hypothetical protein
MDHLNDFPPTLDLSGIPQEADWVIGHTNGGLTIHAKVGPMDDQYGDTPQEALDAAILAFRTKFPDAI